MARLGERGLPFFKLLKRQDKFEWTTEAAEAHENLKYHLQSPPILTAPLPGEELLLYIAPTTHVVSTVIVVECPEEAHAYGVQRLVYFISEVLSESKVRYPSIQKLLYGILITSSKRRGLGVDEGSTTNRICLSEFKGIPESDSMNRMFLL